MLNELSILITCTNFTYNQNTRPALNCDETPKLFFYIISDNN